jgi:hypothetical protein
MLRNSTGGPIPIIDLENNTVLFGSKEEANKAGKSNIIGQALGFETYQWR